MKKATNNKEPKFEDCLLRLESLVQEMESGNLPLEDILKKYEEGNRLVKVCAGKLNEAEQRIEILMKEKNGSLALKAFDPGDVEAGGAGEEGEAPGDDSDSKKELF